MSVESYSFDIDTQGTIDRAKLELDDLPRRIDRATRRALRKLMTWIKRQVLKEAAAASGTTQKALKAALRYRATTTDAGGIDIWIGTNPIKAHYLGRVRWTPRMKGARVGRRLFPGSWSWGPGSKTGPAVMERLPSARRLPIYPVEVEIHDQIAARIRGMEPEINARYKTLMLQELNFAINVESAK